MNRVVGITGGGTGVGAACARLLAAQGSDRVCPLPTPPGNRYGAGARDSARRRWWAMPPAASWAHAAAGDSARRWRTDCLIASAGGMGLSITEMSDAQW